MRSEVEIKEKLSYWRGVLNGMRQPGKLQTTGERVHADTMVEALTWVLTEEKKTNIEFERTPGEKAGIEFERTPG